MKLHHCLRVFMAAMIPGFCSIFSVTPAYAVQPFEIVVMGDTQRYYQAMDEGVPNLFLMQTEWIRDHVTSRNIAFVTQVGDVIQDNSALWAEADLYARPLDGAVPYSVTFGNHDGSAPGTFGNSRYTSYPWYLGSSSDQLAHAQTFTAGGFTFLHINLPHGASSTLRKWAGNVIKDNPGKPTIISTHGYMADNTLGRGTYGNNIWNDLVQRYPQVFMTCNGHDWVTRHEVGTTTDGRKIIQLQVNWQEIINGGNALLQLVKFDPDNSRIDVNTYSPFLDLYHTDFTGKFSFSATFNSAANTISINQEFGPVQRLWNGGGADANWQTAANWGGTAPIADQQLVFNGTTRKASTNNFVAGTRFSGIVFRPGTFSNGYIFSGNRLTLGGDIVNMGTYGPDNSPKAGPLFNLPITLEGDRQINTGDWDLTINGVINGNGSLTKTHGRDYIGGSYDGGVYRGDLFLTAINTYTGVTRVTGGALILENPSSMNLMPQSPSIELFFNTVMKTTGLQNGTFQLASGQSLKGTGKVMGKTLASPGSTIEPGHSGTGTLVLLDQLTLQANSSLNLQLGGAAEGESDCLDVTGSVSMDGAVLNLAPVAGYTPMVGGNLILVKNDGTDPVIGNMVSGLGSDLSTGTALPNNTVISNDFMGSGLGARISYTAGDGNDVGLSFFVPGMPVFDTDPLDQVTAEVGINLNETLVDEVSYGGAYTLTYAKIAGPTWLQVSSDGSLSGTPSTVDLGMNQFTVQVSDGHGGTDTAVLQVQVDQPKLIGRWDFDLPANLTQATLGTDLQLVGSAQAIAGNGANDGAVRIGAGSHFRCTHGIGANGGGTSTNEYTLVFEMRSPAESATSWISFFQTSPTNGNDAECFVRSTQRTIGISTTGYSTWTLPQETWTRIAISVDNGGFYRIYANGARILNAGGQAIDGTYSLASVLLLFADNNGEDGTVDVSSVRMYRTALTDAEVAALEVPEEGGSAAMLFAANSVTSDDEMNSAMMAKQFATSVNSEDVDGDGFTNAQEEALGTNPYDSSSKPESLPLPWANATVGTGALTGVSQYANGKYAVSGSGVLGGTVDQAHFVYQTLTGNGEIVAKIANLHNTGASAAVGVVVRDSLASNAANVFVGSDGGGTYRWSKRSITGGNTTSNIGSVGTLGGQWVKIVRKGDTFTVSTSADGATWTTLGTTHIVMAKNCYIGLSVSSGSTTTINHSQFENLIVTP